MRRLKDSVWGWYLLKNIVGPSKLRSSEGEPDSIANLALGENVQDTECRSANRSWRRWLTNLECAGHEVEERNTSFEHSGTFRETLRLELPRGKGRACRLGSACRARMDGMNWENVRGDPYISAGYMLEYMDLGKVRRAPFSVESCVWLQTHSEGH